MQREFLRCHLTPLAVDRMSSCGHRSCGVADLVACLHQNKPTSPSKGLQKVRATVLRGTTEELEQQTRSPNYSIYGPGHRSDSLIHLSTFHEVNGNEISNADT